MSKKSTFYKLSKKEAVELVVGDQDLKLDIIKNMEHYGGSFVRSLAECTKRADQINLKRLVRAFIVYFVKYQPSKWKK